MKVVDPGISGRDMTVRSAVVALVFLFMACVVNLLMVSINTVFFLSFKDKDAAYREIRTFPLFGVPIVTAIAQFICLFWWFCSYLFIMTEQLFGQLDVGIVVFIALVGIPIWLTMFCSRLSRPVQDKYIAPTIKT